MMELVFHVWIIEYKIKEIIIEIIENNKITDAALIICLHFSDISLNHFSNNFCHHYS